MRKLLLLLAAVMMSVMLMSTTAFAAPLVNSATEPPPEVEIDEPDTPLAELPELPEEVELDEPDIPLGDVPSPQTGVTALAATECMGLLSAAFAVSGGAMLAKARKQDR